MKAVVLKDGKAVVHTPNACGYLASARWHVQGKPSHGHFLLFPHRKQNRQDEQKPWKSMMKRSRVVKAWMVIIPGVLLVCASRLPTRESVAAQPASPLPAPTSSLPAGGSA